MREGIIYEVQSILKVNEDARADDMVLYMAYLNLKGYENEEIQRNMIQLQQEKWKKIRERVQAESKEKKKIVVLLSFSVGMLIVLILL